MGCMKTRGQEKKIEIEEGKERRLKEGEKRGKGIIKGGVGKLCAHLETEIAQDEEIRVETDFSTAIKINKLRMSRRLNWYI